MHQQLMNYICKAGIEDEIMTLHDSYVHSILPPHSLFKFMFSNFPEGCKRHLGADPTELLKFWTEFVKTPHGKLMCRSHPALKDKSPSELDHVIPLVAHGDGAPFSKKLSAMFVQWGSLLVTGAEPDIRFFSFS